MKSNRALFSPPEVKIVTQIDRFGPYMVL